MPRNAILALCALCALGLAPAASAQSSDRDYCMGKPAGDERRTCLREAGAARAEMKRGSLSDGDANFERNKLERCTVHRDPAEKAYCERRMRGEGTVSGSVEGGGLIRELAVTVPADPAR